MPSPPPFGRALTAVVTPMHPDGSLDLEGFRAVLEHLLATGHDGVVVNGTTGEASTTSDDEKVVLLRAALEVVGDRAAVVAGVGTNDTAHSVSSAREAQRAGAHGLLVVTPYYNRPTQAGVVAHMEAVADAADLPVMVYDVPHRTGTPITTDSLVRLAEHPRILAVKDAKGDLWAATHVLAATDLLYYSGDDALTLAHLTQGAVGYVGVATHLLGLSYAAMLAAVDRGDLAEAIAIHRRSVPVVDAIMTTSQGAIMAKAALHEEGVIESAAVRLPLLESPPEHLALLRAALSPAGAR
ncbi:4-hydroxy-tetrahydrodipicolinate synthase [Dermatophilaceae bacterium Soc4.6]